MTFHTPTGGKTPSLTSTQRGVLQMELAAYGLPVSTLQEEKGTDGAILEGRVYLERDGFRVSVIPQKLDDAKSFFRLDLYQVVRREPCETVISCLEHQNWSDINVAAEKAIELLFQYERAPTKHVPV